MVEFFSSTSSGHELESFDQPIQAVHNLSSADDNSWQHQDKSLTRQESNPGQLGEQSLRCAMPLPGPNPIKKYQSRFKLDFATLKILA